VFAIAELPGDQPPPPRLGVQLEQTADGVQVIEVAPGRLGEASGLRKGDRIVSLAGSAVKEIGAVIATLRAAPEGSWLPLEVRREDRTLELLIKFPPAR
jgi:S1-C subfamily serine protease